MAHWGEGLSRQKKGYYILPIFPTLMETNRRFTLKIDSEVRDSFAAAHLQRTPTLSCTQIPTYV